MKRSVQEIVELVVFGAIALLIGTGMLWLVGWIFRGMGWLALAVSGLIWRVLIVLVPIVIVAGLIFWLVNYLMKQRAEAPAAAAPVPAAEPEPAAPAVASDVPAPEPVHEGQPELPNTEPTEPVFPFEGQETAVPAADPADADEDEDRPLRNG